MTGQEFATPGRKLRVLVWCPSHGSSPEGGHRVQAVQTTRALNLTGEVEAVHSEVPDAELGSYDLVHAFSPTLAQARLVRSAGRPLVLSTIYCSKDYRLGGARQGPAQEAVRRARWAAVLTWAALRGRTHAKAEAIADWVSEATALYESADRLLPNSRLEGQALRDDLGVTTPISVVPNAVAPELFPSAPNHGRAGVLMAGRIEPHKNQLRLVRACRRLGLPLTLVGQTPPEHSGYLARCRREGGRLLAVQSHLDQAGLSELYQSAKVHALPSHFETTGLSSLEAALSGCAVVTTSRGFAREYFEDDAFYCDPHSTSSITASLRQALSTTPSQSLRERICREFTWEVAARATVGAYRETLSSRGFNLADFRGPDRVGLPSS